MADAHFGQGNGSIVLDDVECDPLIHCTLLQCQHLPLKHHNCHHSEDAGVRCEQKIVKFASAANVTTPKYSTLNTVMVNATLVNNTAITYLFQAYIGCYNQQHGVYVNISVSNETNSFTTHLRGLFPSSSYTCCTSVIPKIYEYCQEYVDIGTCITIKTPAPLTTVTNESPGPFTVSLSSTSNPVESRISNQTESKALTSVNIVAGILGFIIAVLLILLIALVCLLQPNLNKLVIPKRR